MTSSSRISRGNAWLTITEFDEPSYPWEETSILQKLVSKLAPVLAATVCSVASIVAAGCGKLAIVLMAASLFFVGFGAVSGISFLSEHLIRVIHESLRDRSVKAGAREAQPMFTRVGGGLGD